MQRVWVSVVIALVCYSVLGGIAALVTCLGKRNEKRGEKRYYCGISVPGLLMIGFSFVFVFISVDKLLTDSLLYY